MALTIKRDNIADDGQPVVESTRVTASNGFEISSSPQWQPDKFNTHKAQISITAPAREGLDTLFFVEEKGSLTRIEGAKPYNNSHHYIKEPEKVAQLAGNFGIPAADIAEIHYVKNGSSKISEASITLREVGIELSRSTPQEVRDGIVGAHNETAKQHLSALTVKLEAAGLVPAGTAFEMDKAGVSRATNVIMETRVGPTEHGVLGAVNFGADHNSLGTSFQVLPNTNGGSRIIFGRNAMTDHGGVYRSVDEGEFKAAEKIAKDLGIAVIGESGRTPWGVSINTDRSVQAVIAGLADKGIVNKDVAREFTAVNIEMPLSPSERRKMAGASATSTGGQPNPQLLPT